jgi:hypothetical protein
MGSSDDISYHFRLFSIVEFMDDNGQDGFQLNDTNVQVYNGAEWDDWVNVTDSGDGDYEQYSLTTTDGVLTMRLGFTANESAVISGVLVDQNSAKLDLLINGFPYLETGSKLAVSYSILTEGEYAARSEETSGGTVSSDGTSTTGSGPVQWQISLSSTSTSSTQDVSALLNFDAYVLCDGQEVTLVQTSDLAENSYTSEGKTTDGMSGGSSPPEGFTGTGKDGGGTLDSTGGTDGFGGWTGAGMDQFGMGDGNFPNDTFAGDYHSGPDSSGASYGDMWSLFATLNTTSQCQSIVWDPTLGVTYSGTTTTESTSPSDSSSPSNSPSDEPADNAAMNQFSVGRTAMIGMILFSLVFLF